MFEFAALADRYQIMTRAHERGARDGFGGHPSRSAVSISETERQIVQLAQDELNAFCADQKALDDQVREGVRGIRTEIITNVIFNIEIFQTRAEMKFVEFERDLVRLYERLLNAQKEYRLFKTLNHLDREAEFSNSAFDVFSLLVFFVALDSALNAFFFMDVNPYGLVGGMLMAALISLANTGIGFVTGLLPLRYLGHQNRLHRVWAIMLLAAGLVAIVALNFAVGHYREMLLSSKDVEIPEIVGPMLNSTFVLQTLQSYILTGFGILIAAWCVFKGYTAFDVYPGFGKRLKRVEAARDEFESAVKEVRHKVSDISAAFLKEMTAAFGSAATRIEKCLQDVDDAISRGSNFEATQSGIEGACNAAIRVYRKANLQVRDGVRYPAPIYFENDVPLQKSVSLAPTEEFARAQSELDSLQQKLRSAFEVLTQEVRSIERRLVSENALNERLEKVRLAAERQVLSDAGSAVDMGVLSKA